MLGVVLIFHLPSVYFRHGLVSEPEADVRAAGENAGLAVRSCSKRSVQCESSKERILRLTFNLAVGHVQTAAQRANMPSVKIRLKLRALRVLRQDIFQHNWPANSSGLS